MMRTSDHRGHMCRNVVQKKRSRRFSEGRGRFRLSTATCCRSARTFREGATRLREKTRAAVRNAVVKWSTNPPVEHPDTSTAQLRARIATYLFDIHTSF